MCGKDINCKSMNIGLIVHIKEMHEDECLKFVLNEKYRLKSPEAYGNIRDLFNNLKAPKMLRNYENQEHMNNQTARWLAMDVLPFTTAK